MNVWLGDSWWQCCLFPMDCTSHQHCCHVVGGGFPQAHRDIVTIPALLSQCHHYPPPPSREFPVPLLCRGRAEPEGSARTHPVPPQTLLPLPPPPHAHSSNQAFPFISQSPSPFRHTDGGGGAPEAVTIGTLGALLQDEQQPPSPPLPTWSPPTPGGSSKGWAWVGLAQCPLGGGYMTS